MDSCDDLEAKEAQHAHATYTYIKKGGTSGRKPRTKQGMVGSGRGEPQVQNTLVGS
jgi:hypothetical protein